LHTANIGKRKEKAKQEFLAVKGYLRKSRRLQQSQEELTLQRNGALLWTIAVN